MKESNPNLSLEEKCIEMGAILGLDDQVSEEVLFAALSDDTYAHNLLVCRGIPDYLNYLLENPPVIKQEPIPAITLVSRAAQSLVKWAGTGFSTVSDETYQRRLNACTACPDLRIPPDSQKTLYKLAGAQLNQRSVCIQCGCTVSVKARRSTDTCPAQDQANPRLNRWQEPFLQS